MFIFLNTYNTRIQEKKMSGIAKINNISFGATLKTESLNPDYRKKMEQVIKVFDKATAESYPRDTFELSSDERGQLLYTAECHNANGERTLNRGRMPAATAKKFFMLPQEAIYGKLYEMLLTFHEKDEIYKKGAELLNGIENLVRTEENSINVGLENAYLDMWAALRQKSLAVIKERFNQDRFLKDIQIYQ